MIRWPRPRSVRVRLTLWYAGAMVVVLAVYAAAVFAIVSDSISEGLDERLHDDFDWASDMLAQRPDGTIATYEETGEGDSPWLQVWSLTGELLYNTPSARRNPVPKAEILAAEAGDKITRVPEVTPAIESLPGHRESVAGQSWFKWPDRKRRSRRISISCCLSFCSVRPSAF